MGSPYLSCPLPPGLLPQLVLSQAPTQSSALGQGRRSAQLEKRLGLAPGIAPRTSTLTPPTPVTGWSPAMARSSWNCPPIWAPASTPCNPTAAFGQGPSGSLKTLTRTWRPAQALGARAAPYHGAPWGSLGALQSTPGPVECGLLLLIFLYIKCVPLPPGFCPVRQRVVDEPA